MRWRTQWVLQTDKGVLMIKNFISTSVVSIVAAGVLAGCSAKDCNPSNPTGGAFFGALGCSISGGYDERAAIMKQRVNLSEENLKVAQNRYYKVLLEYQTFMAELTNDHSKLDSIEVSISEVDNAAQEVAYLHDEIIQEEERYLGTKVKSPAERQRIEAKKRTFSKKLKTYAKKKSTLAKKLVITPKQAKVAKAKKELFEKKKSSGLITKNESRQLTKVNSMLSGLKKNNSEALQESQRSTMMVKALVGSSNRRMKENSGDVKKLLGGTSKSMLPNSLPANSSKSMM